MHTLKFRAHYCRALMSFNLPFSLVASLSALIFNENVLIRMINAFSLSLLTGGFLLSVYLYEQRYSNQYFFYHNMGLSKIKLIASAYFINVLLALVLFCVKLYLYA